MNPSDSPRFPSSLPAVHRAFLEGALPAFAAQEGLLGVAASGSFVDNRMDVHSDLDLVLCCEARDHAALLHERRPLAARLGRLVAAFTGEHVGEPRLLICLYGPPALHVDLKVVSVDDLATRDDEPVVLWEREHRLTRALAASPPRRPGPDLQWIEDRFWVWIHYVATKLARGELQEAVEFLSFLRVTVLGPLSLAQAGAKPYGVRRIEVHAPRVAHELAATVARPDRSELSGAIAHAVALYRRLRAVSPPTRIHHDAETLACAFLQASGVATPLLDSRTAG